MEWLHPSNIFTLVVVAFVAIGVSWEMHSYADRLIKQNDTDEIKFGFLVMGLFGVWVIYFG